MAIKLWDWEKKERKQQQNVFWFIKKNGDAFKIKSTQRRFLFVYTNHQNNLLTHKLAYATMINKLLIIGFLLTSKLKKENLRFRLIIKKGVSGVQIDTFWIVRKYDILNFATSSIQYRVWADLDCAVPLYTTCTYETSNDLYNYVDGVENHYKIIKSILHNFVSKVF